MNITPEMAVLFAKAISIYLEQAYGDSPLPANRSHFAALSAELTPEEMLSLKGIEKITVKGPDAPKGLAFRVGNSWYPHMKVTVLPYGREPYFLFGVQTHDHLPMPTDEAEAKGLTEIKEKNLQLARTVEHAWEHAGLPTPNGLLRKAIADDREGR